MNFQGIHKLLFLWIGIGFMQASPPQESAIQSRSSGVQNGPDLVIADFEQDGYCDGWEVEGTAFGMGPTRGNLPGLRVPGEFFGRGLVDSRLGGDKSQGTLTSPEITIARKFIRFQIAGIDSPGKAGVNLLLDGRVVRTSTGPVRNYYVLQPEEWDVSELLGKKVRIQIVDHLSAWAGHILVDEIMQSDTSQMQRNQVNEIPGEGKYLLLPVSNEGRYWANVTVSADNKVLQKLSFALAADKPDWWAFVEIPDHAGSSLRLEADRLPQGSKGLEKITTSTEPTGYTPYQDRLRPQFHYTPRCGYLGDANGLVYYGGIWHLFYQHNPVSTTTFSVLNWGHATSRDLVHWEERPEALCAPLNDRNFLSGSAVIDRDNTAGFGKDAMVAFSTSGGESLYYSTDGGRTFKAWECNPVVSHPGRDPRGFWYGPAKHWVMVVYDETGGKQRNAIYTSANLKDWTFQSAVDGFYECPELFELPIDGNPKETAWLMFGVNNQYLIGQFDGKTFIPEANGTKAMGNYGNCFFAAQTFNGAPDGRRIEMGCERGELKNTSFWSGMSVPLELTLRRTKDGLKMCSYPVRELEQLRENRKDFPDLVLSNSETILPDMNADLKDINIECTIPDDVSVVGMKVGATTLGFDGKANQLSCRDAKAPLKPVDGKIRLRVLADRGILEIFANDGLVYMPVSVPVSENEPEGVSVFSKGDGVVKANVTVYGMKSIWSE